MFAQERVDTREQGRHQQAYAPAECHQPAKPTPEYRIPAKCAKLHRRLRGQRQPSELGFHQASKILSDPCSPADKPEQPRCAPSHRWTVRPQALWPPLAKGEGTGHADAYETSALAGLAPAVCLIGQLAVVMAGAAAIGWGKTSIENSLQPLAPAFGEVEVGAASFKTGGTAAKPSMSQH